MNDKALSLAYSQAQGTGYKGTQEDFYNLLGSNEEAVNLAYRQASDTGYEGEIGAFSDLLGLKKKLQPEVSEPPSVQKDSTEFSMFLDQEPTESDSQPTPSEQFVGTSVASPEIAEKQFSRRDKQSKDYENFFLEREKAQSQKFGVLNVVENSFRNAMSNYEKSYKDTQEFLYKGDREEELIEDTDSIRRANALRRQASLDQMGVSKENQGKSATELIFSEGETKDGLSMLFADGITAVADAPRTLLPMMTGPAGYFFLGVTSASEEYAGSRYDFNLTETERFNKSITSGMIEGMSNAIMGKAAIGLGATAKTIRQKLGVESVEAAEEAVSAFRSIAKSTLGEGAEEGLVDAANQFKDMVFDMSYGRETEDFNLYQSIDAGILGAMAGGAMQAGASALPSFKKAGHTATIEERSAIDKEVRDLSESYFKEVDPDIREAKKQKLDKALRAYDVLMKREGALSDLVPAEKLQQLTAVNRRVANIMEALESGKDFAGIELNEDQISSKKAELKELIVIKSDIEQAAIKDYTDANEGQLPLFLEGEASTEAEPASVTEDAEKIVAKEKEVMSASFETAKAQNPEAQNTDDDIQDQEGEIQEELDIQRDPEAPIEGIEADANNLMDPMALKGEPLEDNYRDVSEKVNNLLKSFKNLGINAVLHTTDQSYFNATGARELGMFRKGKTVHINLEKSKKGVDTVRHEFLHAAFKTLTPNQKQQFLEDLQSLNLKDKEGNTTEDILKAVGESYGNLDAESLTEENVVNLLERVLDDKSLEQSTKQKILNFFRKLFGLEQLNESDLQGFVRRFRAAEREGVEFEGERVSQESDMDSKDLGMKRGGFKSTAYPDLIRKKVTYTKTFLNKVGEEYQLYDDVFINDYWHFRNWWIRETGNGKRGDVLSSFAYEGENGAKKKINPPRPKVDKSTGEIVDMKPKLQTPFEMKLQANQRSQERGDRSDNRDSATESLTNKIMEVVGLSVPGARDAKSEFFVDESGKETEGKSDLPVVFSDTIFTEGLKNIEFQNEYEAAVRSTMDDFAFLVPKNQAGEFAYSIRNNGDGSVTIEVHSNVIAGVERGQGDVLAEGLESRILNIKKSKKKEAKKRALNPSWASVDRIGDILLDTSNLFAMSMGFDQTFKYSGLKDLYSEDGLISSHIDLNKADQIRNRMIQNCLGIAERTGMKDGDIGYFAMYQTLLGQESTLGNPYVFKDVMKNFSTRDDVSVLLNKQTAAAKSVHRLILNNIKSTDREVLMIMKDVLKGKRIDTDPNASRRIDKVVSDNILKILSDNADSFTFSQRTKIGEQLTSVQAKGDIYFKHNDKQLKDATIGEVAAYKVVPFLYLDSGSGKEIQGFDIDLDEETSLRPFKGKIVYSPIFDRKTSKTLPAPKTMIASQRYHLAELMPGVVLEVADKGDQSTEIDVSQLSIDQQKKKLNPRAAISAVEGYIQPTSFLDLDNSTRDPESRDLGLNLDNQTELPFEPNNLNGFQAFMARMDQLFANKYANVMRMQKVIEKAKGKVVDLSKDFINAEALLYGKTANDLDKLDGKVKDISLEMKDKGINSEDVSEYLIARHAKERNAVISERTEGKDEAGSGMTNERADEIMNSLSPEKKAALDSVAAKVDAITADTRKTMVDFGLEEKSTVDAFEAMFQNYVPLGGLALDEQNADTSLYPTGGAGMSVYGDTTKRARGRKSEAQNVLAQAIAQNAAVHAKARKNEALSSLYKLVKDNPNRKVWRLAKQVPFDAQSAVGVRVNGEQQFIVFANPDMAKSLKNMGVEKLDLFSKAMRRFSGFLRRSFTTANPEFIISNFARDIQSAMFNAMAEADIPGGQIPGRHIAARVMTRVKQTLPALLKNAVGKDLSPEVAAYFEEFKEDGGQTGWGFVKDVGAIAAEIESEVNEKSKARKASEWMARNSIEVIENVNDAFENSVRLAAYIEARKAGISREKAAELSKNITVNFNRSGELGPMANAWYMFFNASVQGTVRLARSLGTMKDLRKPNGELESRFKRLNAAQKMAFGLSLTTGMLTMINMAMSDEDEDGVSFYEKIPDYEKERNLIIMYSGKNYFKIPLPYGFNVFANLGTSMAEVANGQREPLDAGMFLLNSAFSSFSPISFGQSKDGAKYLAKGASPTILKPFIDIAVNETYFGSSVYREQFPVGAPKPQAEMSYRSPEGIRKFFQWMNEATGGSEQVPGAADFNPDKFWYAFEYYIGGAGQFITRSLGTGRDLFETIKEGKKVPMKANDFPFIRKLYGESSRYYDSDTYTENSNLVSQLYKERKEAEDKKDKRYKGIEKLENYRKLIEKQIKQLRKLRKEARDIDNYVDRQNRIYDLYEKERVLLMKFNKQYEKIRGKD